MGSSCDALITKDVAHELGEKGGEGGKLSREAGPNTDCEVFPEKGVVPLGV